MRIKKYSLSIQIIEWSKKKLLAMVYILATEIYSRLFQKADK